MDSLWSTWRDTWRRFRNRFWQEEEGHMARAHDSIEIYRARDGWRFRVRASNHRIIASGESYTRKRDAIRGATRAHPGLIVRVVL